MSTASSIPGAIKALVAAVRASIGSTVAVVDGPPVDWEPLTLPAQTGVTHDLFRYLFVAASPGGSGASGTQEFNAAGNVSRDERFSVRCVAYATGSNADSATRRDEAFAIIEAVRAVLAADMTLAGTVLWARLGSVEDVTSGIRNGEWTNCAVTFTVDGRAYLS